MTSEEMIEKYHGLYDYMAQSGEKKNMELFGSVMSEMFEYLSINKPDLASDFLDELCAVKWKNYLSEKEASSIISNMTPKPIWNYDTVIQSLKELGLPIEEDPSYNSYALYVTISSIYSDSADSIAAIMGKTKDVVENSDMLKACYKLAIDKLKDSDGMFNARKYFLDDDY